MYAIECGGVRSGAWAASARLSDCFGPRTVAAVTIVSAVRHGSRAASAQFLDCFGPMTVPAVAVAALAEVEVAVVGAGVGAVDVVGSSYRACSLGCFGRGVGLFRFSSLFVIYHADRAHNHSKQQESISSALAQDRVLRADFRWVETRLFRPGLFGLVRPGPQCRSWL